MTTVELKKNFHTLIDRIDNERLLKDFYDLFLRRSQSEEGTLWSNLTTKEQEELLLSEEESNYETNLISHQEMKKKHQKWLEK
jgi:hypothetical protein